MLNHRKNNQEKTLVHICCAPDASYGVVTISEEFGEVVGHFFNPNIWPEAEYEKRLRETVRLSSLYSFELIQGPFEQDRWSQAVAGLEDEPEKGRRCEVCIRFRLEECARVSNESGFKAFTSVLTVSPKKIASMVNDAGMESARKFGVPFIPLDLKKRDGFKKSVEISKKLSLYRQNYCGCRFSLR